jgi:hypothetical protein
MVMFFFRVGPFLLVGPVLSWRKSMWETMFLHFVPVDGV